MGPCGCSASSAQPALDSEPALWIFLAIGQSNMVGFPPFEAADQNLDPRLQVLAYDNCPNLGREYDEWYTATPPLHDCAGGLGPGDYFGRTLAEALPRNVSIGIVPDAISGVSIDFFSKGTEPVRRSAFRIAPDNHFENAYDALLERARLAQQAGVIKGILFHQGESDADEPLRDAWASEVADMVFSLRTDLGEPTLPLVAGELVRGSEGGCCGDTMNPLLEVLPDQIPGAFVVSSEGLTSMGDGYHFDTAAQRELGRRYGRVMLQALGR
jgi:hypothetical protein